MNAAIRAVVRGGLAHNLEVVGIEHGYAGLLRGDMRTLTRPDVVNIIQRGGTVLGTARSAEFATDAGLRRAVGVLDSHQIDGLVLLGGDGTFRGATALAAIGGPPAVGIPGTIDNDVFGTDRSLGFDTAVNTALEAIDRVRDTAASHEMLHFVEVMGRHSGWLAVAAGLAGGAEAVLCPEVPNSNDAIVDRVAAAVSGGKRSVLIVVAEGYGEGAAVAAADIGPRLGLDYRITSLGHIQRGGAPSAIDRIQGGELGSAAVDALIDGRAGLMVGIRGESVVETPFEDTWARRHQVPDHLLKLVEQLA
ncbi:UNVERIFIED_CONTAM: hypothetical protein GTU68_028873 [Idotea baltica]|nr:hypothetical protein [Idotea baltica]